MILDALMLALVVMEDINVTTIHGARRADGV